jgi:hypothetical protein
MEIDNVTASSTAPVASGSGALVAPPSQDEDSGSLISFIPSTRINKNSVIQLNDKWCLVSGHIGFCLLFANLTWCFFKKVTEPNIRLQTCQIGIKKFAVNKAYPNQLELSVKIISSFQNI